MRVRYHHPNADHMSIEFVNPDREVVEDKTDEMDGFDTDVLSYDLDQTVYVLYAGTEAPESADEVEMDLDRLVGETEAPTRPILLRSLQAFVQVVDDKKIEEGERLRAYKGLEPSSIVQAIDQVQWEGSVAEVGGRLMPNLILRHPFPNANHRTSLTMLERYVAANEQAFDLPKMHTPEYEWKKWADNYIRQSKRILTVRRNAPRLHYLAEFGCDTIVRKGGIEIDLTEWELPTDINRAHTQYAKTHEELCEEFAEEILRRQTEVGSEEPGIGKESFAEYLRELN